jgi:murein DD-endopeptidase MepM/ murein hydrolase activator NlpD
MKSVARLLLWIVLLIGLQGCSQQMLAAASEWPDMLTPTYYRAGAGGAFTAEVDRFILACQADDFHHPLANGQGQIPEFTVPSIGVFGAQKGPDVAAQHHAAVDLHVRNRATAVVNVYAAHDGMVATFRDADKYRHYVSITSTILDSGGAVLGKLVTLYAHIDLDLDEADGLILNGSTVRAGDLISQHLYSGTAGGPHLHFEIRYYRPTDSGDEEFYGFAGPKVDPGLSEPSTGPWPHGIWNPNVGYGFGDPRNHGLVLY